MKIQVTDNIYYFLLSYAWLSLLMIGLYFGFSHFKIWEIHFTYIVMFAVLILWFTTVLKKNNKVVDSFLYAKKCPAKLKIPVTKHSFTVVPNFIGLMLCIFAMLSVVITWQIWLGCFLISLLWLFFVEHPHIWFKNSFDWEERVHQIKNNEVVLVDGLFSYPEYLDGFIYQFENEELSVLWSEINKMNAIMLDVFTHQEVRLFVLTQHKIFSIDESTLGYEKFVQTLSENLTGLNEYWLFLLMEIPLGKPVLIFDRGIDD